MSRSRWLFPTFLALHGCSIFAGLGKPSADTAGTATQVRAEADCGDDEDNDADGATDCGDPDCVASAACNGGEDGDADTDTDTDADSDADADADSDADSDTDADTEPTEVAYSGATVAIVDLGEQSFECVGDFALLIDMNRAEGEGYANCVIDSQIEIAAGEIFGVLDGSVFFGTWVADTMDGVRDIPVEGSASRDSVFLVFEYAESPLSVVGQMSGEAD